MSFYIQNAQKGTEYTGVALLASQALTLDAGVNAFIYVRWDTALSSAEAASTIWQVEGSFNVNKTAYLEPQGGGTTAKVAVEINFGQIAGGTYEWSVTAVTPGGPLTVRLAVTVTAAGGAALLAVPVIRDEYSQVLNSGNAGSFPAIAGFPVFVQLSATNSPTAWAALQLPPGLTLDAVSGVVQGSVSAAGHYQLTVTASNASGTSPSKSFNIDVTDPSGVLTNPAGSAQATAALSLAWLPPEFVDLQFDLGRRLALSAALASAGGCIKQGDDLRFAVIPTLGGVFLSTLVTKIVLTIRRADQLFDEPLAQGTAYAAGADLAPVTVTVGGVPHKYYLLSLSVEDSELDSVFGDLNARATDAGAADPLKLAVFAELRVVWNGLRSNSANIPLTLGQSLTQPAA